MGGGRRLLARFILNITICWLFLHLHFYCRIYSDYPACWRKNWGRSKWGGSVPQRATNIVQFIDIKEKISKVDTGLTPTWSRSEAGSQNILFQDGWGCCLWWQSYDALKHNAHPNVPHELNKCALYISLAPSEMKNPISDFLFGDGKYPSKNCSFIIVNCFGGDGLGVNPERLPLKDESSL